MEIRVQCRQGNFRVDAAFSGSPSGVTALYGPSGAGKTSVVSMVAGLRRPDTGRIAVNGLCLFDSEKGIDLAPEHRRVGYVFQDGRLFPHLTVQANLTYGMRRTPNTRRFVPFDAVVELLGIAHLLTRRPARLSGGEKQRVAIGRALLTSPAVLLMDEPLASLDPVRKSEVLPFIMRLGREFAVPILYVSHAMDEIISLADGMAIMDQGRVVASGSVEDLFSRVELHPHLGMTDGGSVIRTTVQEPRDETGLTCLRFGDRILRVRRIEAPLGASVRVHILSRHVAIALTPPRESSFLNILPGTVRRIRDDGDAFANVCIDVGAPLWSRISRRSLTELHVRPGLPVFALVKGVAVSMGRAWSP